MSRRRGHPVSLLEPWGPAVQLAVLEILLHSVPKASIATVLRLRQPQILQSHRWTWPLKAILPTPLLQWPALQWPWAGPWIALGPPPPKKKTSVKDTLPTLPSSLLQHSLCARGLDELLKFPEPHKGRGSPLGTVGSWASQSEGVWGGSKDPTERSVVSSGWRYAIFL